MKNVDAQFVLRSYRPDGEDAQDPVFKEALNQAHHDPALRVWLEREQGIDRSIRDKLESVRSPVSLLNELRAMQSVAITSAPSFWQRSGRRLAMAAAVALMLGGAYWLMPARQPALAFHAYPRVASTLLQRPFSLDYKAASLQEANLWLRHNHDQSAPTPPPPLQTAALDGVGCKMFNWQGADVLLLCFFLDDGRVAHYFIMEADQLPGAPATTTAPQWAQEGKYATGVWSDGRHAYVLAMAGSVDELQTLL